MEKRAVPIIKMNLIIGREALVGGGLNLHCLTMSVFVREPWCWFCFFGSEILYPINFDLLGLNCLKDPFAGSGNQTFDI